MFSCNPFLVDRVALSINFRLLFNLLYVLPQSIYRNVISTPRAHDVCRSFTNDVEIYEYLLFTSSLLNFIRYE